MTDTKPVLGYVEILSKLSLFAIAAVYATGFFVVSLHQSRYGLASISLVRSQYVLAGLWVLAPLAFLLMIGIWVASTCHDVFRGQRPHGQTRWGHRVWLAWRLVQAAFWTVICIGSGLFVFRISATYLTGRSVITFARMVNTSLALLLFTLAIGFCLVGTWVFLSDVDVSAPRRTANDLLWGMTCASITAILCLAYIAVFTFKWYEWIPGSIGGGAPIPVRFVQKQTASRDTSLQLLLVDANKQSSITYGLLLSTEKSFIVVDPRKKSSAIEIDRAAVQAVVYLP